MSRRTDILDTLVDHCATITSSRGTRGLKFLHEINDFPCFYIHPQNETRTHISYGVKLAIIQCDVRAYVWSDSLSTVELYGRTLETAIQSYATQHRNLVDECRVTSFRTDEGILSPYGMVEMTIDILYRIELI